MKSAANQAPLGRSLSFDGLRRRWAVDGVPVPVRTARRRVKEIKHSIKMGRRVIYPEAEVIRYEQRCLR